MLNPAAPKEAKCVRFSESCFELPLNPAFKVETSVIDREFWIDEFIFEEEDIRGTSYCRLSVRNVMLRNMDG